MSCIASFLANSGRESESSIKLSEVNVLSQGSGNFHRRTLLIELDLVREASDRGRGISHSTKAHAASGSIRF